MNPNLDTLREKANNLPLLPGVYIMLDSKSEVIYVGKAKKLKNRVSSYFHGEHLPKVAAMVDKVRDFNVIIAASEFEALVLENSLIKRHKPHYNILLKDDKGYPFIRINRQERYPRMTISSRAEKDGADYYGPFGGRSASFDIITSINKALKLPECTKQFPRDIKKERPCLNYHMGTCAAWCRGVPDEAEHTRRIEQAEMILKGNTDTLVASLTDEMMAASDALRFEAAAEIRDRIRAIEGLAKKQRVISTIFYDTDAIGFARGAVSAFVVMHFVGGDLVDKDTELIDEPLEDDAEAISEMIKLYYASDNRRQPKQILLPCEIEDSDMLAEFIAVNSGKKPDIHTPKKGDGLKLVQSAQLNAAEEIKRRTTEKQRRSKSLEQLGKMLGLDDAPERIESFDVSNLGNTGICAAMTVFVSGRPLKRDYRKFRMKDVAEQNDYASMYEAVYRRFRRYKENDSSFNSLPDLLLIDGGEEHAKTSLQAVSDLGLSVPIFGMVKDDRHRTRALITPDGEEISIAGNQSVFSLVGTIQEETHRFAIEYQRSLRYENYGSQLDNIPGIGEKRKNDLIKAFKTIKAIKNAGIDELEKVVPKNTAENIYNYFHSANEENEDTP